MGAWGAAAAALTLLGCAPATSAPGGASRPVPAGPDAQGALQPPTVYEVPVDQFRGAGDRTPSFIEVSGTASVSVPADLARVAFAVESRAVTAADAAAENADLMDAVLRNVRSGSFRGLELETFGYSLRPEYAFREDRSRVIEAYTALNNVRATVSDPDAVGGVIDAAIAAGANRITSISFEASDTEAARSEALAAAVRHARDQARVIAESLGHSLGVALEVRGGADNPFPRPMEMDVMMMRSEAAPTPIEPGERTVTANVTVRFALGPELPGH
jgi:uncharacterized protein YggE